LLTSEILVVLTDEKSDWRTKAIAALGSIGPDAREAVPALQKAMSDPKADVRRAAAQGAEAESIPTTARKAGVP